MSCLGSPLRAASWILVLCSALFVSRSATAQISLAVSTTAINFGSVQVGNNLVMPLNVTNTGKQTVTISATAVSGTGFSFAGPLLPITVGPRQSAGLSVSFAPQIAGSVSGTLSITYWACWGSKNTKHYASLAVSVSGTAVTPGYLTAPASLNLGTVTVGTSQMQMLTMSNSGGSSLTISGASVSGAGFSVSGLTFPYSLPAGGTASLSVTFTPSATGTDNAVLSLTSNASDASVAVTLTGTGAISSGTIGVTPGAISFGNVTIGTTPSQSGSITATGGTVTLSSVGSSNSLFTIGGLTLPMTLAAGQSVPFTVTFAPTTTGTTSANLSFYTSSSTSALETASGSGTTIQHLVDLSWIASTSPSITGYNVYRGTSIAGPYSKINSALDPSLTYSDGTVQSGRTYYYVTTAVDSTGAESAYSNNVSAVVPFP